MFVQLINHYILSKETELLMELIKLINAIVENDEELLELASVFGALPLMIAISCQGFPLDLRAEAAGFLGLMASQNNKTLTILIASGGLNSLVELLEYKEKA